MENYVKRLAEAKLIDMLNSVGCVLVSGPKFCGKSTMCAKYASSSYELKTGNDIQLAKASPNIALRGESPHLIDEWQKAPEIWNLIKDNLDKDYQFGKFILTGSTTPIDPSKIENSAAGRIAPMTLKPFSLYESGESLGLVSLSELFHNQPLSFAYSEAENPNDLEDIAFLLCRGGWPISKKAKKNYAIKVTQNYFNGLFTIENESDEFALFLKNKNIDLLKIILKSYARNISSQAKKTKMINDILSSGIRNKLEENTFSSYERTLKDLFIIYDMPAWNLNLRSSAIVRSAPTHHFVDTSIATASLGIMPNDLLGDISSFGLFFEDFAIRDLSIYAESFDAVLKHYRDSSGQEVDAIIEQRNGDYAAIEIKIYSPENVENGLRSLRKFYKKVEESKTALPRFMMLLTSHGPAYRNEDGIYVVPISFLKN